MLDLIAALLPFLEGASDLAIMVVLGLLIMIVRELRGTKNQVARIEVALFNGIKDRQDRLERRLERLEDRKCGPVRP